MSKPSLKIVLLVTSPIAFENFDNSTLFDISLSAASAFMVETSIDTQLAVAINKDHVDALPDLSCEIMLCDPLNPASLASAIKKAERSDLVAIHDAQRPLTRSNQFHRVLEALVGAVDAVRPAAPFTETLKVVNLDQTIERTIERSSLLRISTPEIFRIEVIDFQASDSTWLLPMVKSARTAIVEADPESFRVNTISDIALMESFVHWQKSVNP